MSVISNKIYLPIESTNDFNCYTVFDNGIIRAYKQPLQIGSNNYIDFYVNSHYLYKEGVQEIISTVEMPVCLDKDLITNDKYYRFDLSHILIFVCLVIFILVVGFKVFARLFGRWLKV